MTPALVTKGTSPIVLGQPHGGTFVPDDVMARLNDRGRGLDDTDWHIARLFDGLLPDVTTVRATFHRYVIDANRDPGGQSLYPGANTTALCPVTDFDGHPIWLPGQEPSAADIMARRETYHRPYHLALRQQIGRVQAIHGIAVLFDCHSIRSHIPFLFDGELPVLNIGTNDGATCKAAFATVTQDICAKATEFRTVTNGRFKGGWTTRHYGKPATGVHALQMEIAQRAYMDEAAPWAYATNRADRLRIVLAGVLTALDRFARQIATST